MEKRKGPDHFQFKGFFAQIPRRQYRSQRNVLASLLGLRPQDLDKILRGEVPATPEQIVRIARHFRLEFDDLSLDADRPVVETPPPPVPPKAPLPSPDDLEQAKKVTRAAILAGLQPSLAPKSAKPVPPPTADLPVDPPPAAPSPPPVLPSVPPPPMLPPENRDN